MEPQGKEDLDVRADSTDTKHESFKCPNCEYVAGRKDTLSKHIERKHTKRRRVKCPKCSFVTGRTDNLKRHIDSQHPEWNAKARKTSTPTLSEVWKYFSKVDAKTAKCRLCKFVDAQIDPKGRQPTSQLWRHLKADHIKVFVKTRFFQARKPTKNIFTRRFRKGNASSGETDDVLVSSIRRLVDGAVQPPSDAAEVDFKQQAEAATARAALLEQTLENVRAAEKAKKAEALKLFEVMKAQLDQNEAALRQQLREKDDEIERLRSGGAAAVRVDAAEDRGEQDAQVANARAEQAEQELNDFKEAQKTKDADTLRILEALKAVHAQKEAHLLQQLLVVINDNNRLRAAADGAGTSPSVEADSAKCAQLTQELERMKTDHAAAMSAERRRFRGLQEQHAQKEADLREHLQTAAFKASLASALHLVLKLSDELEQLKKQDVDEHADRLLTDGRPPDGLEKKISALSDELNACKAEKGRLDGTLEYLRNSLRLSDEQRKSSESNAEELQKELEELKNQLRSSADRRNANANDVEELQKQLAELKEENARLRAWPE